MRPTEVGRTTLTVLLALLVVVCVNLAQFQSLDEDTGRHWRAIHRFDSGDLAAIAVSDAAPSNVQQRFGLVFALREFAPGVTLVVPEDQGLNRTIARENLVGLGRVAAIERGDYTPNETLEVEGTVVARADHEDEEPFRLILRDGDVERIVLVRPSGTFVLIDARLLPDDHPEYRP